MSKLFPTVSAMICAGALLTSQRAAAAEAEHFQLTMFGGYAFGGSLENTVNRNSIQIEPSAASGVTIDVTAKQDANDVSKAYYEVAYRKQSTDLDPDLSGIWVENLHVGGRINFFSSSTRVIPYLSITMGATRFAPKLETLKDVTKFSIGVGGGIEIPLVRHVALRLDIHSYTTFVNSDSDAFCRRPTPTPTDEGSTCIARWSNSLLLQGEGSVGVTFGF